MPRVFPERRCWRRHQGHRYRKVDCIYLSVRFAKASLDLVLNMLILPSAICRRMFEIWGKTSLLRRHRWQAFVYDLSILRGLPRHSKSPDLSCMLAATSSRLRKACFHRTSVDRRSIVLAQASSSCEVRKQACCSKCCSLAFPKVLHSACVVCPIVRLFFPVR